MAEGDPDQGLPHGEPDGDRHAGAVQRRGVRVTGILLGGALLVVLGFAPAAYVVSASLPVAPEPARWHVPASGSSAPVRDLPAGLPAGPPVRTPADLADLARLALGPDGAEDLLALLAPSQDRVVETAVGATLGFAPYPYSYPALNRILDRAPGRGVTTAARELGASLTLLAALPGEIYSRYPNAAPAAYAALDRARSAGDCLAQLNLLLLVASDNQPRDGVVRDEAARAEAACPDDPTPGWVLAQFESQRSIDGEEDIIAPFSVEAQQQALVSVEKLMSAHPRSGDALTAAADFQLRAALGLKTTQPFTARHELRLAAARYRAAIRLGSGRDARSGLSRALVALNEPVRAIGVIRPTVDDSAPPGPRLEILTAAQEAAHRFATAEGNARRLHELGDDAYSTGPVMFPVPQGSFGETDLASPRGAMSIGTDAAPLTVDLQPEPGGAGAGGLVDISFIPEFRPDFYNLVGSDPNCPDWAWRRDAVLAGHADTALVEFPTRDRFFNSFSNVRPDRVGEGCGPSFARDFRRVIRLEAGEDVPLSGAETKRLYDARQNMWRWAGDLAEAERVAREWIAESGPRAALPMLRLAEIEYLRKSYHQAAAAFGTAARRTRQVAFNADVEVFEALVGRGAALLAAGRRTEGRNLLRPMADSAAQGAAFQRSEGTDEFSTRFAAVSYYARAQLATDEFDHQQLHAAVEDYEAAGEMLTYLVDQDVPTVRPESLYGNQALAELALGRTAKARLAIDRALERDPRSPVFLMTSGFVAERSGHIALAVRHNRAALVGDPGAFAAANDLGVLLARDGRTEAAIAAFRRAVGARADYALGWFNLGVALSELGPARLLSSQGALARAFALDPDLAEREREPTIDARTYRTGLDLSKPLPARWSFSSLQDAQPVAPVGLLALAFAGIGFARAVGQSSRRDLAERWLEPAAERIERLPFLKRLRNPLWGISVTVVILTAPAVLNAGLGTAAVVALGGGVLVAALVGVEAREVVAARSREEVDQASWAPGILFGLATVPFGAAWAPLPVTPSEKAGPRVYAAAPVTLGLVAVLLLLEAVLLHVPLTVSLATATIVMAASTLLPVAPLDGARLGSKGLLAGVGTIGAAILVSIGLG